MKEDTIFISLFSIPLLWTICPFKIRLYSIRSQSLKNCILKTLMAKNYIIRSLGQKKGCANPYRNTVFGIQMRAVFAEISG